MARNGGPSASRALTTNAGTGTNSSSLNRCPVSLLGNHEMHDREIFHVCADPTIYSVNALNTWVQSGHITYPHNRQTIPDADIARLKRMHQALHASQPQPQPQPIMTEVNNEIFTYCASFYELLRRQPQNVGLNSFYLDTWEGFWNMFDDETITRKLSGKTSNVVVLQERPRARTILFSEKIETALVTGPTHRDIIVMVNENDNVTSANVFLVLEGQDIQQALDEMMRELNTRTTTLETNARNISPSITLHPPRGGASRKNKNMHKHTDGKRYKVHTGPKGGRYIVLVSNSNKRVYL